MTDIEELALLRKIKQAKESGDLQGELIASRELSAARSAGTTAPAAPAPAPAPKSATGRIQEHGAEISRIMRGESPYGQSRGGRAVGVTAQALAAPWQYAVEPLSALVGAGAKAVRYAVPPDVRQTYKSGLGSLAGMIAPKVAPIAGQAMADWTIDPKTGRPRSPEEQAGLNRFAKDVATIATAGTPLGLVKPVAKVAGAVVREAGLGDVIRAAGQYVKKGGRKGIQETYKIPSPIAMQAGLTHPRGENKILDWMDEFRLEGRPNAVAKKAQSKIDKLEIDADKALEAQIAKTPDETVNSANVLGGLNEDLLTGKIEGTAMATPKELNGMSSRIAMMLRRKGLLGDIPLSKVPELKRAVKQEVGIFTKGAAKPETNVLDKIGAEYYRRLKHSLEDKVPGLAKPNNDIHRLIIVRDAAEDADKRIGHRYNIGLREILGTIAITGAAGGGIGTATGSVEIGAGAGTAATALAMLAGSRKLLGGGRIPAAQMKLGRLLEETGKEMGPSSIPGRIKGALTPPAQPIPAPPVTVPARSYAPLPADYETPTFLRRGGALPILDPGHQLPPPMLPGGGSPQAIVPMLPTAAERIRAIGAEAPAIRGMSRREIENARRRLARMEEQAQRRYKRQLPSGGKLSSVGGGAALGGAIGSQYGDTPEERARNAARGFLGGGLAGTGLAAGMIRSQVAKALPNLTPQGQLAMKAITDLGAIDKSVRDVIGTQKGATRPSVHNYNRALQGMPEVRQQLLETQAKNPQVDFVDKDGFLKPTAMESVPKPNGKKILDDAPVEQIREELRQMGLPTKGSAKEVADRLAEVKGIYEPKYGGFSRSIPQMYWDGLDYGVRESIRKQMYNDMRAAYEQGGKGFEKGFFRTELADLSAESRDLGIAVPLRSAEKTGAAFNSTTACPMFTIGNRGCWDACYTTQMGAGGNTFSLYKNAPYTGEILRMTQKEINLLNKKYGGLRVNGGGDFSPEHIPQLLDMLADAKTRGLNVKLITKQEGLLDFLSKAKASGKEMPQNLQVQPSYDYMWSPVKVDLVNESGAKALQVGEAINAGNLEGAAEVYRQLFGREAKIIDGELYRKYGFSKEQVEGMRQRYPNLEIVPRVVVATAEEAAAATRDFPRMIITMMHGKVPDYIKSEIGGDKLNFGGRHKIEFKNGKARIGSVSGAGTVISERSSAHEALEKYINTAIPENERQAVVETLKKNTCCQAGASEHACADCGSTCGAYETMERMIDALDKKALQQVKIPGQAPMTKTPAIKPKGFLGNERGAIGANMIPELPEKYKNAFLLGKELRDKNIDLTEALYGQHGDDLAKKLDWLLNNDDQATFFEIGRKGENIPEYVIGERYGEIPEGGRSTNFREQKYEKGTSLMNLVGEKPTASASMYETFNKGNRAKQKYGGWLVGYGSDGEPLILGSHKINEQAIKPKFLGNERGSAGPSGVGMLGGMAAGGVTGATAGAAMGGTPEERRRNALLGLAAGTVGGSLAGGAALSRFVRPGAAIAARGERGQIGAWHGSPHLFAEFDAAKIGTGEGAQAFGHGLYFTSEKEIAKNYAHAVKRYSYGTDKNLDATQLWNRVSNEYGSDYLDDAVSRPSAVLSRLLDDIDKGDTTNPYLSLGKRAEQRAELYDKLKKKITNEKGNTYSVTLHKGKTPDQYDYLKWDKSFEEMPEATQKAIRSLLDRHPDPRFDKIAVAWKYGKTPEEFEGGSTGESIYRILSRKLGSDKAASNALLKAGIDGIDYPAGTLSGAKSSARNYVVFDPKAVTIERVNEQAIKPKGR